MAALAPAGFFGARVSTAALPAVIPGREQCAPDPATQSSDFCPDPTTATATRPFSRDRFRGGGGPLLTTCDHPVAIIYCWLSSSSPTGRRNYGPPALGGRRGRSSQGCVRISGVFLGGGSSDFYPPSKSNISHIFVIPYFGESPKIWKNNFLSTPKTFLSWMHPITVRVLNRFNFSPENRDTFRCFRSSRLQTLKNTSVFVHFQTPF